MAALGAYGKLPGLGDFFRIGLGRGFVSTWDRWLQESLAELSADFGSRWESCYMSAPVWRFSLSAGVAGERAAYGVMMPSVDRVGRKFPLTLAAELTEPEATLTAHFAAADAFSELELIALGALGDDMTPDLLRERLKTAQAAPVPPPRTGAQAMADGIAVCARGAGSLVPALAAGISGQGNVAGSIWSMCLESDARLMTCSGLPAGPSLAGLFDLDAVWWAGLVQ